MLLDSFAVPLARFVIAVDNKHGFADIHGLKLSERCMDRFRAGVTHRPSTAAQSAERTNLEAELPMRIAWPRRQPCCQSVGYCTWKSAASASGTEADRVCVKITRTNNGERGRDGTPVTVRRRRTLRSRGLRETHSLLAIPWLRLSLVTRIGVSILT